MQSREAKVGMQRLKSMLPAELQSADPKRVTHDYCVELIRTPSVDLDRLQFLANYLTSENWQQVCEERSMDNVCAWPMCAENTAWTSQESAQVLSPANGSGLQILDRTELFCYCGADHMELSKQVEASLSKEPWWLLASRTKPVDLGWLSVLVQFFDFMDVDATPSLSTPAQPSSNEVSSLENFEIVEHNSDESGLSAPLSKTQISEPQPMAAHPSQTQPKTVHFTQSEALGSNSNDGLISPQDEEQRSTPTIIGMDVSEDAYSDSEEDDDANAFFDSSFSRKKLDFTMSPNMLVLNTILHWVTPKTQLYCSQNDYKPHLHNHSLHVASQMDPNSLNEGEEEPEISLNLPPVDGLDIDANKRALIYQFVSTRLSSMVLSIPELDKSSILKVFSVLISTFDLTMPVEALKTQQWNSITVAFLAAVSPRLNGLSATLERHRSVFEEKFGIQFDFVQEVLSMFAHRG